MRFFTAISMKKFTRSFSLVLLLLLIMMYVTYIVLSMDNKHHGRGLKNSGALFDMHNFSKANMTHLCFFRGRIMILLVYVDYIIITGTDSHGIWCLEDSLHASFHMKYLGSLTYFLGLEIHASSKGIFINQVQLDFIALARLVNSTHGYSFGGQCQVLPWCL